MAARAEGNGRRRSGAISWADSGSGRPRYRAIGVAIEGHKMRLPDRAAKCPPRRGPTATRRRCRINCLFRASHPCVPARGRRDPAIRRSNDLPRHRLVRDHRPRPLQRHDLRHRLRDRRHRDELRDARVALPQPLFRQRHLHLGVADLDRADGPDARILPRRLARRPHRLAQRAGGDGAGGVALHAGAALVRAAAARAPARRHRRRAHRQPGRLGGDPAVSGDLLRHVFAVRDPADAALRAELRHGVGHGLRRLDLRLDRRHARHHLLPDPDHRHARDHAVARRRRHRLRADPAGGSAAPSARPARPPPRC